MERRAAAYDYRLDISGRASLTSEQRESHIRYVARQMETLLSEKFNVLLSTSRYNLADGKLYGENMRGAALDSFRRGRDHRRIHGNPVDFAREDAEIVGLETTQDWAIDPNTRSGDMRVSISKPSGTYRHNFYDIFTKKRDERGEYVEARRYSSGLRSDEYVNFARELGLNAPANADAAFFLGSPISIKDPRFKTAEDIHRYLHREHEYMTKEEFKLRILEPTIPFISTYVNEPSLLAFKAVLNRSDEVYNEWKNGIVSIVNRGSIALNEEIFRLGNKDIKEENLPCGNLSNAEQGSAFSVVEFDITYSFDKFGSCKKCGSKTALGPCGVCRGCDVKSRQEQKFGMAA